MYFISNKLIWTNQTFHIALCTSSFKYLKEDHDFWQQNIWEYHQKAYLLLRLQTIRDWETRTVPCGSSSSSQVRWPGRDWNRKVGSHRACEIQRRDNVKMAPDQSVHGSSNQDLTEKHRKCLKDRVWGRFTYRIYMMTPKDHISQDLSYFSGPSTSGAITWKHSSYIYKWEDTSTTYEIEWKGWGGGTEGDRLYFNVGCWRLWSLPT